MVKQTRITIETDTVVVLKGKSSIRAWCARCGADAEMVALDAAAVMSNLRPSEIEEWINSVDLHRSQAADGMQLICLNSLLWAAATKKE